MNKHKILKEWVNQFLEEKNLSFETIEMNLGARALVPNYGDYVVKTDVLGNKYKEYTFAFVGCELIDYGTSDVNEKNMNLFDTSLSNDHAFYLKFLSLLLQYL
jgi:FAD synthase